MLETRISDLICRRNSLRVVVHPINIPSIRCRSLVVHHHPINSRSKSSDRSGQFPLACLRRSLHTFRAPVTLVTASPILLVHNFTPLDTYMSTRRSHSSKGVDEKPSSDGNGSLEKNSHEHKHDHDHEHEHTHTHSIFGHSHGEDGHSHDAEKIVEALQGSGRRTGLNNPQCSMK